MLHRRNFGQTGKANFTIADIRFEPPYVKEHQDACTRHWGSWVSLSVVYGEKQMRQKLSKIYTTI
jgi:hypothetical protein